MTEALPLPITSMLPMVGLPLLGLMSTGQVTSSIHNTGSFSKDVFSQGAEYQVFLGVFMMFLAFFHSKIWAKFHFGTFEPYD